MPSRQPSVTFLTSLDPSGMGLPIGSMGAMRLWDAWHRGNVAFRRPGRLPGTFLDWVLPASIGATAPSRHRGISMPWPVAAWAGREAKLPAAAAASSFPAARAWGRLLLFGMELLIFCHQ